MKSSLFSLLAGIILIVYSAAHTNNSYGIFWDPVGILIVLGGTITVACTTFSPKKVWKLMKTSLIVMQQKTDDAAAVASEIITLAKDSFGDLAMLQDKISGIQNFFLKDGIGLIVDRHEASDIENIMRDRIRIKQENDDSTSNMLKTLAKYPPSFGIIGTVLGLIALMLQLGSEGAAEKMGPAMALGLVATLYGLVLTNFILQPLAENLALKSHEDVRKRQIAMLGVLLIKNGKSPLVIQEAINSLLPVSERVDVLGVGGGGSAASDSNGRTAA
jgi:chemotaxis protein MotA